MHKSRFTLVHWTGSTLILAALAMAAGCSHPRVAPTGNPALHFPGETHLANLRQLTQGGTNAEAYWAYNGEYLTFQHKGPGIPDLFATTSEARAAGPACDQIYSITVDGKDIRQLSDGRGRTTCSFYLPGDERILFASTQGYGDQCPPEPDMSRGYVWPIYDTYQIYSVNKQGEDLRALEPGAPRAYNAEAVTCKDGSVIFTSDRDGDLDLYAGKLDSLGTLTNVKRLTNTLGYDGGAFFSQDCKKIVWRASRPRPGKEADEYKALLKQHLVKPGQLEIWVANADGSHARQVTRMGVASFAPYFTPSGDQILFAANPRDPRGRKFDIYLINTNGTGLERVTFSDTFDSFPMFSPDGKYLAFSSNRNASKPRETNVFIADWIPSQPKTFSVEDTDPANRFYAAVEKLSAPEMEGRGVGTPGMEKAENWVAERFAALGLKPFLKDFKQEVEVKIAKTKKIEKSHNIVGALGGACGKTAPVVIGAHLDHLGHGTKSSLEATQSGIHHGADDNASGVAALFEVVRILKAQAKDLARSCYVIAAFTGEEEGIAGSSRLAELFKKKGPLPKAMLNMDMVGRLENGKLTIFGTDSAVEWKSLIEPECAERQLTCPGGGDGYGPSDHMAFYIAKVPVLHFFTGPHADYHRVSDTVEKVNATGGVQVAETVAALAMKAAAPSQKMTYKKATAAPMMGTLRSSGEHKGHGAYLGTIPDYSSLSSPHGPGGGGEPEGGVKLSGARSGSPAEKAGIKEGDILLSIEIQTPEKPVKHSIRTLEDFTKVLMELKPEDKIVLGIRRNGELLSLPAIVGKRQ